MEAGAPSPDLSLLGGPLHRLGARLGLVRHGTNTVFLGVAIGGFLWVVILALALAGGVTEEIFSLPQIVGHVLLLIVIPLLFVCETLLDPRVAEFTRFLVRWHIVPEQQVQALNALVGRINRCQSSWWPEGIFLVFAVLTSPPIMHLRGYASINIAPEGGAVIWWYSVVCITVFRFLLLRWAWRLCLWTWFLWRVSRLQLRLLPTHPDRTGGLGYLEVVQSHFLPLIVALSTLKAAGFAGDLATGAATFDALYLQLVVILLIDAALVLGPVLMFVPKLWACRLRGLRTYMGLAERYVHQFDSKWFGTPAPGEPLLGTPDIQSLADLSNSVTIVREMRWAPISSRLLITIVAGALVPTLPLLLMKYPIAELTTKLFTGLFGL
jgi:hypothetical protein